MKTRNLWSCGMSALMLCMGTSVWAAPDRAGVQTAIDDVWRRYVDAARHHSAAEFGALFAENAVLMSSDAPTHRGRTEIQSFLASLYADVEVVALRTQPDGLEASSTLAVQGGTFEEEFLEAGRKKTESGRFLIVVRRKAKHDWRIVRLIALPETEAGK